MTSIILAIETSCDETAVAIIEQDGRTVRIRSHLVRSQAEKHAEFGGVFPNLAKREHAAALPLLIREALKEAAIATTPATATPETLTQATALLSRDGALADGLAPLLAGPRPTLSAIAVTRGPGLEPALWVGLNAARALALAWDVPLYPMNHMEGHIAAALVTPDAGGDNHTLTLVAPPIPAVAVLISGGHTEFDLMRGIGHFERIGETRDDAVGEAYDKAARLMGLPYPGGPKIAALAEEARTRNTAPPVPLPRPMATSGNLDTSFSGLKTAVRYAVEKLSPLTDENRRGLAREFEDAVTEVLIRKTHAALEQTFAEALIIGGGVVANTHLREAFARLADIRKVPLLLPATALATDNALMIALALALRFTANAAAPHDPTDPTLAADGTWRLA